MTGTVPRAKKRRPHQQRSRNTVRALCQAFVQISGEHPYRDITIREITLVAGTALGSFYDYFADKRELARLVLHLRSKTLLVAMRGSLARNQGKSLRVVSDEIVGALGASHPEPAQRWTAYYLLERHLSDLGAYRKMYESFVATWDTAISGASDWPAGRPAREDAEVCMALLYGLFSHYYLDQPPKADAEALKSTVQIAIRSYLDNALTV